MAVKNDIEVRNLRKNYYEYKVFKKGKLLTRALKGVSFNVKRGDFIGLLGLNGAGKTTLMKILTTNMRETSGKVLVNGFDVNSDQRKVRKSISWMYGVDYYGVGWASVQKNLELAANILGLEKKKSKQIIDRTIKEFGLQKFRKLDVWRLSTGLRARYSLAVAMMKNPKILFLDEPLIGLDVESKDAVRKKLNELNQNGLTILYTSHQLNEVEKVCKKIILINDGKIVHQGYTDDLKNRYRKINLLEIRCKTEDLVGIRKSLLREKNIINDIEVLGSRGNEHQLKIYTNVDSSEALLPIGKLFKNKNVILQSLNVGTVDLETVFKKVIKKKLFKSFY
ncbi:MAG: ABC transporter ATP-binding protein [Nanoarchaeota archaeon]